MYRILTDAIAYDHIAEMRREAATLRLAGAVRDPAHRPWTVQWSTSLRAAVAAANTMIPTIRRAARSGLSHVHGGGR